MYIWKCGSSPIRLSASSIGPVAVRMTALGQQTRERRVSIKDAIQSLNAVTWLGDGVFAFAATDRRLENWRLAPASDDDARVSSLSSR